MVSDHKRILLGVLLPQLACSLLFATTPMASPGNVTLDPPVAGLGASVEITVHHFDPPIHLSGDQVVSGAEPPEWLPALSALLSPQPLTWDALERFASKEYIEANRITPELLDKAREAAGSRRPELSILYFVRSHCGQWRLHHGGAVRT